MVLRAAEENEVAGKSSSSKARYNVNLDYQAVSSGTQVEFIPRH